MTDPMAVQQRAIDAAEILFKEGQNPLFALDAYSRARSSALPVPEWVLQYLDASVRELGQWVRAAQTGIAIPDVATKVTAAFGMKRGKGQATVFAEFADQWLNWEWAALGERVAVYVRSGNNETDAIQLVADDLVALEDAVHKMGVIASKNPVPGKSKIRAAWKRYIQEFPDTALPK
jgi:hypothetical protein